METWEVYRDLNDAIGPKRVASAMGVTLPWAYRLGQPPEADGARSDLDRFEQLVDVAAAYPDARPALRRARYHIDGFFRRALDHESPQPLTDERLAEIAGHICQQVGELLMTIKPGIDKAEASKEGSDVIDAVQRFMKAMHQPACNIKPPLRAS